MKQFKTISITTDFQVPFSNKYDDSWIATPGSAYQYAHLIDRKKQKPSHTLLADYHFSPQKTIGFFIGTGIGYKNLETSIESVAHDLNAHIFSLSNIAVPLNIGLDIRPTKRLNINLSATYEHMFATNNSWREVRYSGEQLTDPRYVYGELPDNLSSLYISNKNKGGGMAGVNVGFDIDVYKNYRLLLGAGIGYVSYSYDVIRGAYYFSPWTGEPDTSGMTTFSNPGVTDYSFLNLKVGIAKTF